LYSLLVVVLIVGGTASHVHVSLKKSGVSPDAGIDDAPGLNVLETEFIAGLMDHLRAVAAFVMPTMASYERLVDGAWAVIPSQIALTIGWDSYLLGSGE
jgi:glutamine synthetase